MRVYRAIEAAATSHNWTQFFWFVSVPQSQTSYIVPIHSYGRCCCRCCMIERAEHRLGNVGDGGGRRKCGASSKISLYFSLGTHVRLEEERALRTCFSNHTHHLRVCLTSILVSSHSMPQHTCAEAEEKTKRLRSSLFTGIFAVWPLSLWQWHILFSITDMRDAILLLRQHTVNIEHWTMSVFLVLVVRAPRDTWPHIYSRSYWGSWTRNRSSYTVRFETHVFEAHRIVNVNIYQARHTLTSVPQRITSKQIMQTGDSRQRDETTADTNICTVHRASVCSEEIPTEAHQYVVIALGA